MEMSSRSRMIAGQSEIVASKRASAHRGGSGSKDRARKRSRDRAGDPKWSKKARKEKKKNKKHKKERRKDRKPSKRSLIAEDDAKVKPKDVPIRRTPSPVPHEIPKCTPPVPEVKREDGDHCYGESDPEGEQDLSQPLHRIQDYFEDKSEMCHQMFSTLRGRKLRSMIPEVLRGCTLMEVRELCRQELEGMSRKRVLRILGGDDPKIISSSSSSGNSSEGDSALSSRSVSSSSSSSSSSPSHPHPSSHQRRARKRRKRERKSCSTAEHVVDSTCKESPRHEEKKAEELTAACLPQSTSLARLEVASAEAPEQDVIVVSAADLNVDLDVDIAGAPSPSSDAPPAPATDPPPAAPKGATRTQLEIFELEMRARAIRAMLVAQEKKDPRVRLLRK